MMVEVEEEEEAAAVGRGGGRRSGKARVVDQTAGIGGRASTPLSICRSDLQERDEAQNSVTKGAHFRPIDRG